MHLGQAPCSIPHIQALRWVNGHAVVAQAGQQPEGARAGLVGKAPVARHEDLAGHPQRCSHLDHLVHEELDWPLRGGEGCALVGHQHHLVASAVVLLHALRHHRVGQPPLVRAKVPAGNEGLVHVQKQDAGGGEHSGSGSASGRGGG